MIPNLNTYERNHDIPFFFCHLGGDGKEHQHVVALSHTHGVQIAQHIGASNLS